MSVGQEFAVSAVAAGLSHLLHHPLYTLKSQMMFYGPEFKFRLFIDRAKEHKGFLYRGKVVQWNSERLTSETGNQGLESKIRDEWAAVARGHVKKQL